MKCNSRLWDEKKVISLQVYIALKYLYSHVDKIVGTLHLKKEKPTIVTELTWNWQK